MQNDFENSILKTLVYFDLFDFPLTSEELHRWLWRLNISYEDFLDKLKDVDGVDYKDGFYFLPGRKEIIKSRQRAIVWTEKKMKIAKKAVKKLRWLPFIQAVFVCNNVALGNPRPESDIDVFIVTKRGRLSLSRFIATTLLQVLGLRPSKKSSTDKICLSFWVTDQALDLRRLTLGKPDIYMVYWLDQLLPLYDPESVQTKIIEQNKWAKKYIPNGLQEYKLLSRWRVDDSGFSKKIKILFEKVWNGGYGDFLNERAKAIQAQKIKSVYGYLDQEHDTRVVVSDTVLKFHKNDRREEYRKEWEERCKKYEVDSSVS